MVREIGSEFHKMPPGSGAGLSFPRPGTLVFSGRTAIEAVLKEIPDAKSALLPSYCCLSVIVPFMAAGIDVIFYEVDLKDGKLQSKIDKSADILLWCDYFGYRNEMPGFDGVIIEDITHSLLSQTPCHTRSDYLVASVRKWEPLLSGGYCSVSVRGAQPSAEFIKEKSKAMELKREYLENGDESLKERYLDLFRESNRRIAEDYYGLLIDGFSKKYLESTDTAEQRRIRRENAHVLYDTLKGRVHFLFPEEDMDCPLFVPIVIPEDRDRIRARLIEERVYCPVHWQRPGKEYGSSLYDTGLSLICDQRYNEEDMVRQARALLRVFKN